MTNPRIKPLDIRCPICDNRDLDTGGECSKCGYNGRNFYQAGSHAKDCPFHSIGGAAERAKALPKIQQSLQAQAALADKLAEALVMERQIDLHGEAMSGAELSTCLDAYVEKRDEALTQYNQLKEIL